MKTKVVLMCVYILISFYANAQKEYIGELNDKVQKEGFGIEDRGSDIIELYSISYYPNRQIQDEGTLLWNEDSMMDTSREYGEWKCYDKSGHLINTEIVMAAKEINRIKLVYGLERTLLPVSALCTPESFNFSFGDDINFLTTYDEIFINRFLNLSEQLLKKDKNDSIQSIDPRIMVIVSYKDVGVKNDTICFGEYYGICKNGVLMQDNSALLKLVKNKIGWDNRINLQKVFIPEINLMKQFYSDYLILLAMEHVANNLSDESGYSIIDEYKIKRLLRDSPEMVDNLLYMHQKEKSFEILHRFRIWCEAYTILTSYLNVNNNQIHTLYKIPSIKDIVTFFFKDKKQTVLSDNEKHELIYVICNYLSKFSDEERIRFYRSFFENYGS